MSKALNQVMNYANEDEVSIYKHWVVFVRAGLRSIITALILFITTFMIASNRFNVKGGMLIVALIISSYNFFKAYSIYKTTVLTINNIRIYGETGLKDLGAMNAPLDEVVSAIYSKSFFGQMFGYGSVRIELRNGSFVMDDMINVEAFCEAVILMREAHSEAKRIRQDERNDKSRQNAAIIGAQATIESAKIQAQLQSEMQAQMLEGVLDKFVDKLSQANINTPVLPDKNQIEESETE